MKFPVDLSSLEGPPNSQILMKAFFEGARAMLASATLEKKRDGHSPDPVKSLKYSGRNKCQLRSLGFQIFSYSSASAVWPTSISRTQFCLATSQPIKMQLNLPSQLILNWDWLLAVCLSQVFIG